MSFGSTVAEFVWQDEDGLLSGDGQRTMNVINAIEMYTHNGQDGKHYVIFALRH